MKELFKKEIANNIAFVVFAILPLIFLILGLFSLIFYGIGLLPVQIPGTMTIIAPFVTLFAIAGSDFL